MSDEAIAIQNAVLESIGVELRETGMLATLVTSNISPHLRVSTASPFGPTMVVLNYDYDECSIVASGMPVKMVDGRYIVDTSMLEMRKFHLNAPDSVADVVRVCVEMLNGTIELKPVPRADVR